MRQCIFSLLLLAGCSSPETIDTPTVASHLPKVQEQFFANLTAQCGNAFTGALTSNDAVDADMRTQSMVMHVRDCSADEIRIPFFVGDDRSRTWVISRTQDGLRLKHDHRHKDGTEDKLTQYGGDTADEGTPTLQRFPADEFSKSLFTREGIPQSNENTWSVEIVPGQLYAYELTRPNRKFRVEFDLTRPLSNPPPPPWGDK